ncbi:MAG: HAMP domain-containing sensor histidine kinase [Patulibacter minatonensis]
MRSTLPIRWRLALLIATVTTLVLVAFAVIVGTTTTARLRGDFEQNVRRSADDLAERITVNTTDEDGDARVDLAGFRLGSYARGGGGIVQIVAERGKPLRNTNQGVSLGGRTPGERQVGDLYVVTRELASSDAVISAAPLFVQYARSTHDLDDTISRIELLLILATIGGAAIALVGASWLAGRALRPVSELTATANAIARTGDGSRRLPIPNRKDELAELAMTLDAMLDSLDAARTTTEKTLQGQRDFLADASHELRTPLTSVITNLEMLEDTDDPETAETAAAALRSARRMRGLVADLLALARADATDGRRHVPVSLPDVVTDAVSEVEDLLAAHTLTLDCSPVKVLGDRDDLQRVVRNLLENAARHTPAGTSVQVTAGLRGGQAVLSVEDDGPGLPAGVRGRAFERFVRSGARSGPSSGLGLSIVRATAQAHGGWVELRSPARAGRGTRVDVRLPIPSA